MPCVLNKLHLLAYPRTPSGFSLSNPRYFPSSPKGAVVKSFCYSSFLLMHLFYFGTLYSLVKLTFALKHLSDDADSCHVRSTEHAGRVVVVLGNQCDGFFVVFYNFNYALFIINRFNSLASAVHAGLLSNQHQIALIKTRFHAVSLDAEVKKLTQIIAADRTL